jgi:hypothetical protein
MDKVSSRHTEKDHEMPVDLRVGTLASICTVLVRPTHSIPSAFNSASSIARSATRALQRKSSLISHLSAGEIVDVPLQLLSDINQHLTTPRCVENRLITALAF